MPQFLTTVLVATLSFFLLAGTPSFAAGTSDGSSAAAPEAGYPQAKATVDAGNYTAALPMLVMITKDDPRNADAWNLLGFTYRMLGQNADASVAYLKVLAINPGHLGALEYQGELFIQTGKLDMAQANLARLKSLCGECEEFGDLEKALTAAGA